MEVRWGRVLHVEVRWARVEEVRWGKMWYVKLNEPGFKNSEAGPGVGCGSEVSQGVERN